MISPMDRFAMALILIVAFQHVGFFILETFLWQKPIGLKISRLDAAKAAITAPLAANQGVYNAFLAAGLFWGLSIALGQGLGYLEFARRIETFFLCCVVIAGIVGGMTVNRRIMAVQSLPAAAALFVMWLAAV